MILMGLDISKTATGWAVADGDHWEGGVLKCPIKRPFDLPKGKISAEYAGKVSDWYRTSIYTLINTYKPEEACIEQPIPGNSTRQKLVFNKSSDWAGQSFSKQEVGGTSFETTHFLHGLSLQTAGVLVRKGVNVEYVSSQTWRSVVGVGRPPKSITDSAKRRQWLKEEAKRIVLEQGVSVTSDDEAEARCIVLYMRQKRGIELIKSSQHKLFFRKE